jgi:hypothetical protein
MLDNTCASCVEHEQATTVHRHTAVALRCNKMLRSEVANRVEFGTLDGVGDRESIDDE